MKTLRLALDFSTEQQNQLTPQMARIYVAGNFVRSGDNRVYLSPDCAYAEELDEAIDYLHGELEAIRAEGRAKFTAALQK
jgi:hypothetical protein